MEFRQALYSVAGDGSLHCFLDGVEVPVADYLDYLGATHTDLCKRVLGLAEKMVAIGAQQVALEEKIHRQRGALSDLNEAVKTKNLALDALHHVWCSGGCVTGAHRFVHVPPLPEVTEELVHEAEVNVRRLRQWFDASRHREART